jgi:mono/diheme cytochrome c family protein
MKGVLGVWLLMLLMPSAYASELPGDSAEGKRLYEANCMGCHDTGVHTRKDRIVQSLDALKKRLGDAVIWQEKNSPRLRRRTSSST